MVRAAFLAGMVSAGALAAAPDQASNADILDTPAQVAAAAMRQSIGAPARADIDDQATARLSEGLFLIPQEPAARLLAVMGTPVPPDFKALLLGADGMDAPGFIRFVPAGFVDADLALSWTAGDMLASLKDTVERANPDRLNNKLREREARRWIRPPHYDPQTHQLSWAALIVPKSAPSESDGETMFHAIGFGREGYVELTVLTSEQKAGEIGLMADNFLVGLNFRPGKAYGDALPTDQRAPGGLAGAMGIDSFHKADTASSFLAGDRVVPVAGGIVAGIGALSLFISVRRHLRRNARRI